MIKRGKPVIGMLLGYATDFRSSIIHFKVMLIGALLCAGCANSPTQPPDNQALGPYERLAEKESESVVGPEKFKDPLQPVNRFIFGFNHYTYRYFLTPVSQGYQAVVPEPVDVGIGNFFNNLREPLYSFNYLLQFKPKDLGNSLLRFGINSTVGLLGIFDLADKWGMPKQTSGFDDTLASYGAGYGTYIVLPLLGPSDIRSTADTAVNYFLHPLKHIDREKLGQGLLIVDGYHRQVDTLANYQKVINDADDPYIFVRNLYLQGVIRDDKAMHTDNEHHPSTTFAEPEVSESTDRAHELTEANE